MARRAGSVTQADISKLIKAALAAGVGKEHIVGVRLDREGATLLFGEPKLPVETTDRPNEWDEVLDDK
jgi:hypothetical protein